MAERQDESPQDADLVRQSVAGDHQAFGVLYDRYSLGIYRFLCAQLNDPYEAEDLTSEVFLRAWRSLSRYRELGHPFSAYLFRIARNCVIDHRRKFKLQLGPLEGSDTVADDSDRPSEVLTKEQESLVLQDSLRKLKETYRSVLVLRFLIGLSTAEVALIMSRSEGSIRVLQHRALKKLRKWLESAD